MSPTVHQYCTFITEKIQSKRLAVCQVTMSQLGAGFNVNSIEDHIQIFPLKNYQLETLANILHL